MDNGEVDSTAGGFSGGFPGTGGFSEIRALPVSGGPDFSRDPEAPGFFCTPRGHSVFCRIRKSRSISHRFFALRIESRLSSVRLPSIGSGTRPTISAKQTVLVRFFYRPFKSSGSNHGECLFCVPNSATSANEARDTRPSTFPPPLEVGPPSIDSSFRRFAPSHLDEC